MSARSILILSVLAALLVVGGCAVDTIEAAPPSPVTAPEKEAPGGGDGAPAARPVAAPERSPRPAVRSPSRSPVPAAPAPGAPTGPAATHVFPVRPVSAASFGPGHHDYPATDIFAACGTEVVSPVAGIIHEVSRRDDWDPAVTDGATRGGLSISIIGDDGVRYYGSHYETIRAEIQPGVRVTAGQLLGTVGRTGSARPTPCHLHFGISPPCGTGDWEVRRGVVDTWPYLDAWRSGRALSPLDAVSRWRAANPERCAGS